jgi:hypothetical protein
LGNNTQYGVSIVISALDKATSVVRGINKQIAAEIAPLRQLNNSFRLLSDEAGLGKLASSFGEVEYRAGRAMRATRDVALGALAIGAGAAFAGERLFGFVRGEAELADRTEHMAKRLDMSAQEFQEYAYAAKQSNVPVEAFASALAKGTRNLAEAATGTGSAFSALAALQIDPKDKTTGKLKNIGQLIPEISDKVKGLSAPLRELFLKDIFGKSGGELDEFFRRGPEGIKKLRVEAEELGGVMSGSLITQGDAVSKLMGRMDFAFQGAKNTLAEALLPTVSRVGEDLVHFFQENRVWLSIMAEDFAAKLPAALDTAGKVASAFVGVATPVAHTLEKISNVIGPTNTGFLLLGGYVGSKLIPPFLDLGSAMFSLAGTAWTALDRVLAFAGVETATSVVKGMAKEIVGMAIPALSAATTAAVTFGQALWASPLTWYIGGITAIAGLAYLVYKNWEPVKNFLSDLWQGSLKFVNDFIGGVMKAGRLLGYFLDPSKEKLPFYLGNRSYEDASREYGRDTERLSALDTSAAGNFFQGGGAPVAGARAFGPGPAIGGTSLSSSATQTVIQRQEGTVKLFFEGLPEGTRVDSKPNGIPVEIYNGQSRVNPL